MSENESSILDTNQSKIIAQEDDTTFNKLKELQKLLKKESAVKELYIKMKNETQKSIEHQCVEVYKKKMEVLNILQKIRSPKNQDSNSSNILKEHVLVENNYEFLSSLTTYVTNSLKYLWEEPKLLADLLLRVYPKEIEENLAPLICNNFYENILSPNYIEDPLLYIIYLLLKNEIDKFQDINQGIKEFLHDTPCSYLLKQLIEKNDVKEFFKIILGDILEDLGSEKFMFNISELNNWQRKRGKTVSTSVFDKNFLSSKNIDNKGKRLSLAHINSGEIDIRNVKTLSKIEIHGITEDDKENIKNNINYQVFTAVYLTSVPLSEIRENINKYNNDLSLRNYYEYLLSNTKGDYSQTSFFEDIYKMKDAQSILVFYQENFLKVKDFLNKFLENIISNYRIIPHSIKCVAKIIYQLICNKFPDANEIQKNLFISIFFYRTLILHVLEKPDINALINNYIISNNTLYNMTVLSCILWTLASFKLFKDNDPIEGYFTPFNRVFLEKIPEIFQINKLITDVNLPHFIDGLISKKINEEEYYFDYFNENPNDISFYQSMLLNIKEFNSLFSNLFNFKDDLLEPFAQKNKNDENISPNNNDYSKYIEFKKRSETNKKYILIALKKIRSTDNLKVLSDLLGKVEYSISTYQTKTEGLFSKVKTIEEKKEIVKYFHVSQLLFNEKSKKIFSLEQKKYYYHIDELKEKNFKNINPKELLMKNNIIKCKNFLSSILYNYRILEKNDFNKDKTNNIMDILKELTHFMKASNYFVDGSIPSEWYLISLMECLKKLPDDYKNNEYAKLFEELASELNESIKKCNFEYMSIFLDEMKFGNRNKNFYERVKAIYMDIELNNKANDIIENDNVNISLDYQFTDKKQEFIIYQENVKDKKIPFPFFDKLNFESLFKGGKTNKTIEQFTKDFPNLNEYKFSKKNSGEKINIFEWQKMLDIPNKLTTFFTYINEYLKNKVKNENELKIINDKIYDYVMSRIYDKIYPKVRNILDINIFENACQLNWIEPENVLKGKVNYDFDFVLPDINNYFNSIRNEKSPRRKLINLNNIFISLNKLIKFTKGDVQIGVDDQIPLLTYCFIKTKPWGIYTDSNFMQLYIGNKKNKNEDNELSQLLSCCDFIKQIKYDLLNNVSKDEFDEKGKISLNELSEYMSQFDLNNIS